MKKTILISISSVLILLSLSGCGQNGIALESNSDVNNAVSNALNSEIEVYEDAYEIGDATLINLDEEKDNVVNITKAGTYELTGSYEGQIRVNAGDSDKVKLVLNNANINTDTSACIYVINAKKVLVSCEENSTNYLRCTGNFIQIDDKKIDGAIFSREDLQISGHGSLYIECETGHGVVAKDDLDIKNVSVNIISNKKGIEVNDALYIESGIISVSAGGEGVEAFSITIDGGNINIVSGDDGMNATGGDQSTPGSGLLAEDTPFVLINGGSIDIDSVCDGIDSNGYIAFNGGFLTIDKPETPDDECLDYESTFTNNGGTLNIADNSDTEQMSPGGIGQQHFNGNGQDNLNEFDPNNKPNDSNFIGGPNGSNFNGGPSNAFHGDMNKPDFNPNNQT